MLNRTRIRYHSRGSLEAVGPDSHPIPLAGVIRGCRSRRHHRRTDRALRPPFARHVRLVGRSRSPGGSSVCIPLEDGSCSARVVACGKCGTAAGDPSRTTGRRTRSRRPWTFSVRGDQSQRTLSTPAPLLGPSLAFLVEVAHPLGYGRLPRVPRRREIFEQAARFEAELPGHAHLIR